MGQRVGDPSASQNKPNQDWRIYFKSCRSREGGAGSHLGIILAGECSRAISTLLICSPTGKGTQSQSAALQFHPCHLIVWPWAAHFTSVLHQKTNRTDSGWGRQSPRDPQDVGATCWHKRVCKCCEVEYCSLFSVKKASIFQRFLALRTADPAFAQLWWNRVSWSA